MKPVRTLCVSCAQEVYNQLPPVIDTHSDVPHEGYPVPVLDLELRDDLTLRGYCPKGHNPIYFLQAEKFEVLFDLGIMALLDGYSREAGSSIAAAIERFHECAIGVFVRKHIDKDVFRDTWKQIDRRSEC